MIRAMGVLSVFFVWCCVLQTFDARAEFIVYAADMPPYSIVKDGEPVGGMLVDIFSEMMRRSNMAFDAADIRKIPWSRAMNDTELHPGRLVLGAARMDDREARYKWIGPLCNVRLGLIAKKARHIRIRTKE
ncbi:MAG: hypothetical protein ACK5JO_11030, partial [Halodesulfovibrio sp.]